MKIEKNKNNTIRNRLTLGADGRAVFDTKNMIEAPSSTNVLTHQQTSPEPHGFDFEVKGVPEQPRVKIEAPNAILARIKPKNPLIAKADALRSTTLKSR